MIKLAMAVGFLAVFGFVAYAIIVLLVDRFKNKSKYTEEEFAKEIEKFKEKVKNVKQQQKEKQ